MKKLTYILLALLLSSCSGTGIKNFSTTNAMIMDAKKGKAFVGRESTFDTWAETYDIFLNTREIGKLGGGETVTGTLIEGRNTMAAKFGGLLDFDIGKDALTFEGSTDTNKYFIVTKKLGFLTNSLRVTEVTEDGFKNTMRE